MKNSLNLKFYKSSLLRRHDFEMYQISKLITKAGTALDIGANIGFYSYHCSKIFTKVHAFEPISVISENLREYSNKNEKVVLHDYALSNKSDEAYISVPKIANKDILNYGYASLSNEFDEMIKIKIKKRTLDSFNLNNVDFIKIDVEGHEAEVIEGGLKTISENKPLILIEIEKRHSGMKAHETIQLLISIGYKCFFYENKIKKSYDEFCFETDQNKDNLGSARYICNFFFISC